MVTEPYLRFATGGEEQEISEHKAVENAIELSTDVRKADSTQGASPIKRRPEDKQRSHRLTKVRYAALRADT